MNWYIGFHVFIHLYKYFFKNNSVKLIDILNNLMKYSFLSSLLSSSNVSINTLLNSLGKLLFLELISPENISFKVFVRNNFSSLIVDFT